MNPPSISHHGDRPVSHTSVNLFKSLIPPRVAKQQAAPFASSLAHEVRNPLTNINLAVEMLRITLKGKEEQNFLDIIMRGSGRINDLVTDLLMTCRNNDLQPKRHSVHQLLEEVLITNKDRIMLKNITIRRDYTTPDCKILADKEKIKIALTNIIINAIEAMPPKNGKLRLTTKSAKGQYILEISDNGIGISEDNLKKIFDPFFTNKAGGMGLGLSTTRSTLLSYQVGMNVRSVEGRGTTFVLSFNKIKRPVASLQDKPIRELA